MVVLVSEGEARACVRAVVSSHAEYRERGVLVQPIRGRMDDCVRDVRRAVGSQPLAVMAQGEAAAFEALSAGADEALVLAPSDSAGVLYLLDRARLKADARQQYEQRMSSLIQLEKLSTLGTLVAGIAQEINAPVTGALLSLEMLRHELSPLYQGANELRPDAAHARTSIDDISRSLSMISEIIRDIGIYARATENEARELVSLPSVIDRVLRLLGRELMPKVHVERDIGSDVPPVLGPRSRITQVITNLLTNAVHAVRDVDRGMHRIRIGLRADDEVVTLSVTDSGPGIAADVLDRVFDPFFTTKRDPAGAGLGLAVSRSIMRSLGGDLVAESVHGDGATFIAWLPRPTERQLQPDEDQSRVSDIRELRRSVLIVDENPRTLSAVARVLRDRYEVLLAQDGHEAVELLSSGACPDAVIADGNAKTEDGTSFHSWLLAERPELARKLLLMTQQLGALDAPRGIPCLLKPVEPMDLLRRLDERLTPQLRKAAGLIHLRRRMNG